MSASLKIRRNGHLPFIFQICDPAGEWGQRMRESGVMQHTLNEQGRSFERMKLGTRLWKKRFHSAALLY
jgi:hypothetical protein